MLKSGLKSLRSSAASLTLDDNNRLRCFSAASMDDTVISALSHSSTKTQPNALFGVEDFIKSNLLPNWMYERPTLWDDFLPVTDYNSEVCLHF